MVNKTLTIIIFSCLYIYMHYTSNLEIGKNRSENAQNIYIYITYTTFHAPRNRGLIIIYYIVVGGGGGGGGPLEKCVVL